jgi:3-oxoacyl-[acyl-carrier protein] reductase
MIPDKGARVVVVGGCGGIGRAIVEAAFDCGARVTVMDLPASLAARRFDGDINVSPIDVADEASVMRAFAGLDAIDALINVFGYTPDLAPIETMETRVFDEALGVNLRGAFLTCRAGAPKLRAAGAGALLNISTGIAGIGAPGYAPYAAAKAGLNALTRVLASELAPVIAVNALAPGGVDTAFLRGGFGRGGVEDGPPHRISIEDYAKRTPMARIATAQDIVGPALFLVSPAARYITGQVLHVNGGALMRD